MTKRIQLRSLKFSAHQRREHLKRCLSRGTPERGEAIARLGLFDVALFGREAVFEGRRA